MNSTTRTLSRTLFAAPRSPREGKERGWRSLTGGCRHEQIGCGLWRSHPQRTTDASHEVRVLWGVDHRPRRQFVLRDSSQIFAPPMAARLWLQVMSGKSEGYGSLPARKIGRLQNIFFESDYKILPPFQNIRCFRFVKQMYLDML
jgi:hypothetical protein